jgi:fatty-acyl-CoA synthase
VIVTGPPSRRYRWEPITIAQQLDRTAAAFGGNDAVVGSDRRLTWRAVRGEARALAKALVAAGVARGEHIAVWLPNQVEWIVAWFGAAYAGVVVVPINTRYKAEEAHYILHQSDSKLLLCRSRFLEIDFDELLVRMPELPELRRTVTVGRDYDAFLAAGDAVEDAELHARVASVSYDDPTIIVYTSGTTGHPKGAVHTHRILRNECSITEWMGLESDSRLLGHMPFFHVAGSMSGLMPPLISGGAIVLMERWDVDAALSLVERERITSLSGIPTHFIDLLDHPRLDAHDLSSLRCGWIGGAANPPEVLDGVMERLGIRRLLPVYGMTETTSVTTFPRPDDPREVILSGKGVPVSDFELKVAAPGEEAEVCVRGHNVMQGYYRNPEATAAAIDDAGWFHTGDLGVLDENGYLAVTGRKSDMFIVGGANVYPAEVELALAQHPEITQAYVVGVADRRLGEVGFAFVQRRTERLTETDVREFCAQRLANFKVPRHVRFVEEWPLTATGKIQRFRLRELAAASLPTDRSATHGEVA